MRRVLWIMGLLSGCSSGSDELVETRVSNLQGAVQETLSTHCASCHGPSSQGLGGFNYVDNIDTMIDQGQIVVGSAATSPLYMRMIATDGTLMPPSGGVSASAIEQVREYIDTLDGE